jgi:hypothetical protein
MGLVFEVQFFQCIDHRLIRLDERIDHIVSCFQCSRQMKFHGVF